MRLFLTICTLFCVSAAYGQSVDSLGTFGIETVTVDPRGEDRAYGIMRQAIAAAPFHRERVGEYSSEVYVKGSFEVTRIPKLFTKSFRRDFGDIEIGTRYVDESFSRITFRRPNHYDQQVMRRTTSLPPRMRGDSPIGFFRFDIYQPASFFISPLSPGAFSHYKFRYDGFAEYSDGRIVNRIEVTPTRHSSELVRGWIWIVDGEWGVHEFDLSGSINILTIDFGYRLHTQFDRRQSGAWMPVRHNLSLEVDAFGIEGSGGYFATVEYLDVKGNSGAVEVVQAPVVVVEKNRQAYRTARRTARRLARPEGLDLTERMSNNYKMTVDSAALAPDTLFWSTVRPEPLAPEELRGYAQLRPEASDGKVRDTTARRRSAFSTVVFGKNRQGLAWRGIVPTRVGFNTVDGFYFGIAPLVYSKTFSAGTDFRLTPDVGWAINRRAFVWTVDARLRFAPMHRGQLTLRGGQRSQDYAGSNNIDTSLPSLFFRKNYLKLYGDNFVEGSLAIDVVNGLTFKGSMKYADRRMLDNNSDFSFFYRGKREYGPNIPLSDEVEVVPFDHSAAVMSLGLEFTPRYYYRVADGRKQMVRSPWPTLFVTWERGLKGVGESVVDFHHFIFGVKQNLSPGSMRRLDYFIHGGFFSRSKSLFFADYRHFGSTDFPLTGSSITSDNLFHLLPRYKYSTADRYLEAHIYYQAPVILIKNIPWFGKRLWREGIQINYLTNRVIHNYTELGYTVGLIWQAGIFVGFDNFKYRSFGFKVSLPLGRILSPREGKVELAF